MPQGTFIAAIITLIIALAPLTAQSKPLICPFTDTFTIAAPNEVHILRAATQDADLKYTQLNHRAFTLSCRSRDARFVSYLHIDIGYDETSNCRFKIKDGSFIVNPTVEEWHCQGNKILRFMGIEHDFGSYDYVLRFTG